MTSATQAVADPDLDTFLLRRRGAVHVPPALLGAAADSWSAAGLTALDGDLLQRGHVLGASLRATLARLHPTDLALLGSTLLARLDALYGADRRHRPLFRGFPDSVPDDAQSYFSEQMRQFLLSQPHQPCVRCGRTGAEAGIGALAPCAHLVCADCLDPAGPADGAPLSACPVCGAELAAERRLGPGRAPYSHRVVAPEVRQRSLVPLTLAEGADPAAAALAELELLLARRTPLPPQDREDLAVLLAHAPADLADRLPDAIPVRETRATVLAALVRRAPEGAEALLRAHVDTATDVLRILWALSGAEPDLLPANARRLRNLPRPLRRSLLAVLDALPLAALAEDLRRHRQAWLRAGELLHPSEHRRRFPSVAAAFALLRQTDLEAHPAAAGLLDVPAPLRVDRRERGTRLGFTGFGGQVEARLAAGDPAGATALLAARPGELVRRLHHLLRVHATAAPGGPLPEAFLRTVAEALRAVGPGPLLGAYGRLRGPRTPGERRLYFPRGSVALAHAREDHGTVVPAELSGPVCELIEAELLRRAQGPASGRGTGTALLDEGLADLVAPFAERAAAKTLVPVPRGSVQPLPDGGRLRLFLHWMQPEGLRVDLDLSIALYGADWQLAGLCDFTSLVYGQRAAVHSGDLVDAPPPHGATEFADLDLELLAGHGVRYAVVLVLAYNDIAFEELTDAFTGFMDLAALGPAGDGFDPRAVRQRMDLAGDARVCVPMIVDLAERRYTWTDLNTSAAGGFHDIARHGAQVGQLCADVLAHFAPGARATLWDLACVTAAADAREVLVRARDGKTVRTWRRADDEPAGRFAARLRTLSGPDGEERLDGEALAARLAGTDGLLCLVDGDLPVPAGRSGTLYRLRPGPLDAAPDTLRRLGAGDLVARFAPEQSR
ncbi:MXAN_6230/SCO0854 family RING domain-containing protein [Kitasatospora sp. NPDC048540]|uniref:MXAN_6230/SCO0854 family RING domain-containing protein n=1 Tax=unclassified Kitasatospora TaxID=2633591 RepID=UPI000539CD77|nr:MXAN_6230/SCO0854 family RING domain-containing protein [Kitasatospora sp. MBT63]